MVLWREARKMFEGIRPIRMARRRFGVRALVCVAMIAGTTVATLSAATAASAGSPLVISTTSLLGGTMGQQYSATLAASGGKPPYKWSVSAGSLPRGLHLKSSTGLISGKPRVNGTFTFTVKVLDQKIRMRGHPTTRNSALKALTIAISSPISPGAPTDYATFSGGHVTLIPWVGQNVAVLTPPGGSFDSTTMTKVIRALDAAWNYYASTTGRQPTLYSQYMGHDTIAVVTTSCGAACSYLGFTGTEINPSYFQTLYDGVKNSDQYDQALFYEFGRNFWFYGSQLAPSTTYGSTATTGFAVLMRFQSMNAIGVQGGPFNGTPFTTFEGQVWGIAGNYDVDLTKTFANTLAVGNSPSVYGGTDFFASIIHLLATHYGGDCFIQHFLATVLGEPSVSTDAAAVTNFITAASHVVGADLGPFFYNYWSFPLPNGTSSPRAAGGISALPNPSPVGMCPA
jgi:hypothetical protein